MLEHLLSGFKQQCASSFEALGDKALHADDVNEALRQYSSGLSLKPPSPHSLFVKRSKARVAIGLWQRALQDADEVSSIRLPLCALHDTCQLGSRAGPPIALGLREEAHSIIWLTSIR